MNSVIELLLLVLEQVRHFFSLVDGKQIYMSIFCISFLYQTLLRGAYLAKLNSNSFSLDCHLSTVLIFELGGFLRLGGRVRKNP